MDESDEARQTAKVLGATFENVGRRLIAEKGVSQQQVGLAMLAAGVNLLGETWDAPHLVRHMVGVASGLSEALGVDPETGELDKATLN